MNGIEIEFDTNELEKEIQKVFEKLPKICSDYKLCAVIMQLLDDGFVAISGRHISLDY